MKIKYLRNFYFFKNIFLFKIKIYFIISKFFFFINFLKFLDLFKFNFIFINNFFLKKIYLSFYNDKFKLILNYNNFFLNFKKYFIKIIYENKNYILINKPFNILIHSDFIFFNKIFINYLLYYFNIKILKFFRIGILNRLDKNTSGLLIISKNLIYYLKFLNQLKFNLLKKYYFFITFNKIRLIKKIFKLDYRKIFVKKFNKFFSKTFYNYINFYFLNNFLINLVKCNLITGKINQIRLHFNYLKTPILGDLIYNNLYFNLLLLNNYINRQIIHSYFLSFYDFGKKIFSSYKINLSFDILNFLKIFKLNF